MLAPLKGASLVYFFIQSLTFIHIATYNHLATLVRARVESSPLSFLSTTLPHTFDFVPLRFHILYAFHMISANWFHRQFL